MEFESPTSDLGCAYGVLLTWQPSVSSVAASAVGIGQVSRFWGFGVLVFVMLVWRLKL